MIDIKLIRERPDEVKAAVKAKRVDIDIDAIAGLDARRRALIGETETLKAEQNKVSQEVATLTDATEKAAKIEAVREKKERSKMLGAELEAVEKDLDALLRLIPNLPRPDVKVGRDDAENEVVRHVGDPTAFPFEPLDATTIGERHGIIDTERAAKVSGTRFGYLKGDAALLEFALVNYVYSILLPEGFVPVVPPVLVKERAMWGMGYLDRGGEEIYKLGADDLYLVGTSEQSIGPMHADETFAEKDLPRRYVGFSSCFRREAGSYGKDTRGILRVHQFDKLEMFSFTTADRSDAEHDALLMLEERIVGGLGLPYRVIKSCTGDLGDPAARKYDIEAWVPSQKTYREVTSTSTTTDWQARRLGIKVKRADGTEFAHLLNGTACAVGRMIIAILENYQQEDGSVRIPDPLLPYMHGKTVIG
jgi:seryl-tRNA synthetase